MSLASLPQAKRPLTKRQQECLEFIIRYHDEHGYSPAYRDIMNEFGYASLNSVKVVLRPLIVKGYLATAMGVSRSIVILRRPDETPEQAALRICQSALAGLSTNEKQSILTTLEGDL